MDARTCHSYRSFVRDVIVVVLRTGDEQASAAVHHPARRRRLAADATDRRQPGVGVAARHLQTGARRRHVRVMTSLWLQ